MMPTDGNALRNRISRWVLHYASLALASAVVFAVVVFLSFVLLRLRVAAQNQIAIEEIKVRVGEIEKRQGELVQNVHDRIAELEFTVYGTLEPRSKQPVARPSVEPWMRNRDAELRKMVQALQRRLLELENAREDDE